MKSTGTDQKKETNFFQILTKKRKKIFLQILTTKKKFIFSKF